MKAETDNRIKIVYAISVCILYFIVAILAGRVTKNFQIAFGIFCTYWLWSLFWTKLLLTSEAIYSVKVVTKVLPNWLGVSLPSEKDSVKIRKDRVVTSISELSGIRGGKFFYYDYSLHVQKDVFHVLVVEDYTKVITICIFPIYKLTLLNLNG